MLSNFVVIIYTYFFFSYSVITSWATAINDDTLIKLSIYLSIVVFSGQNFIKVSTIIYSLLSQLLHVKVYAVWEIFLITYITSAKDWTSSFKLSLDRFVYEKW